MSKSKLILKASHRDRTAVTNLTVLLCIYQHTTGIWFWRRVLIWLVFDERSIEERNVFHCPYIKKKTKQQVKIHQRQWQNVNKFYEQNYCKCNGINNTVRHVKWNWKWKEDKNNNNTLELPLFRIHRERKYFKDLDIFDQKKNNLVFFI